MDKKREKPVEREQTICPIKKQEDACRIKRKDVSPICQLVNEFIVTFKEQLDELTGLRWDSLSSGSYYEKTKVRRHKIKTYYYYISQKIWVYTWKNSSVAYYWSFSLVKMNIGGFLMCARCSVILINCLKIWKTLLNIVFLVIVNGLMVILSQITYKRNVDYCFNC